MKFSATILAAFFSIQTSHSFAPTTGYSAAIGVRSASSNGSSLNVSTSSSAPAQATVATVPKVAQRWRKSTKQLVTLGPASSSPEVIEKAYSSIGDYYFKVQEIEDEAKELNNLETLFDMQKSTYKQLKDCRNELVLLKQMWDLISLIDYQFDEWKETLWAKIKTDDLLQLVEKMRTGQCNP